MRLILRALLVLGKLLEKLIGFSGGLLQAVFPNLLFLCRRCCTASEIKFEPKVSI